jgi:hypothetical protein
MNSPENSGSSATPKAMTANTALTMRPGKRSMRVAARHVTRLEPGHCGRVVRFELSAGEQQIAQVPA